MAKKKKNSNLSGLLVFYVVSLAMTIPDLTSVYLFTLVFLQIPLSCPTLTDVSHLVFTN
jgi:hypothetical protein